MAWSAIYETATGRLVSVGSVVADPLPAGLSAAPLADRPDPSLVEWSEASRTFVAKAPAPKILTPAEFLARLTMDEMEELSWRSRNGTTAEQRAIGAFFEHMGLSGRVNLSDAKTISRVQLMETRGIVAAGRAAQILA